MRKAGAWYTYDGDQLGQGREKAKDYLRQNPELAMQLQDQVLRAVGLIEEDGEQADDATADDVEAGSTPDAE
ncbi:MAG: hypothetical protein GWP18_03475 [Proteobacteria bacterium]|nr:hypothetical protein [Pseudomonadota bacterium]